MTLLSYSAKGQFNNLGIHSRWSDGTLTLTDNTVLKGLVQFNDKLGLIKYKADTTAEEEQFSERHITHMSFFDEEEGRKRKFGLFTVNSEQSGRSIDLLFEILFEFERFALLSRIERVNISVRTSQNYYSTSVRKVGYEQFERFCLVSDKGVLEVVLVVSEFERDKLSLASKMRPQLNTKAIERFLGAEDWKKFRQLVKHNNLKLTRRSDFLRAFALWHEAR